eukprot:Gb_07573 [translate_table: standard]
MSILRPLDASGSSSSEGCLYIRRINRVETPGTVNPSNMMRVHYRPEHGGISLNPWTQLGTTTVEIHPQTMESLSKRSLSDVERQTIFRAVRQRNQNSPLPLSPVDSVVSFDSLDTPPQSVRSYPHHSQQPNINSPHSQGSIYSPPTSANVSDSMVGRFPSLPNLQGAATLVKSESNENFTKKFTFNLPNSKLPETQRMALGGSEKVDIDPDGIKHRLQELERELLSDNDDAALASAISPEESSNLDQEWADTIQNILFEESVLPPPTFSGETWDHPDSYKKRPTSQPSVPQPENQDHPFSFQHEKTTSTGHGQIDAGRCSKKLLVECATAIYEGKIELASNIIKNLMQMVSIYGDPMQRLTGYMVEGLVARLGLSRKGLCNALRWKEMPSRDHLSALQILFEVCPYFKFGCMAANGAILEAFKGHKKVHIIDFDIGQGSQYISLIQSLAVRIGGPPEIRITGVDDPGSMPCPLGGLHMIGECLLKVAETVGVPLQFHTITEKAEDVQPGMLGCRPGEALAVNFAFQLHHMPDESVSTRNPRDQLLRMVKSLNPKVVTVVEKEVNTNTAPFLPRFIEALNYYSAVFESLDITLARESRDRTNIEKQCLARDIVNIVACEGAERTERYEVAGKWRARMTMAGFTVSPLSTNVENTVKSLLRSYNSNYTLKLKGGALHFGWLDKTLIVASAWH